MSPLAYPCIGTSRPPSLASLAEALAGPVPVRSDELARSLRKPVRLVLRGFGSLAASGLAERRTVAGRHGWVWIGEVPALEWARQREAGR